MTKTDRENAAIIGDRLERWYAARGSRRFTGVWEFPPVPDPVVECSSAGCPEPARITEFGVEAFCADHFPAVVG